MSHPGQVQVGKPAPQFVGLRPITAEGGCATRGVAGKSLDGTPSLPSPGVPVEGNYSASLV